jgi:hypothetical protein
MNMQNDALPAVSSGRQSPALLTAMPPRTGCCEGTMIINTGSMTAAALLNPYAC